MTTYFLFFRFGIAAAALHNSVDGFAGDTQDDLNPKDFMLVCGSCNRAKSWSCEHCANWQNEKSSQVCLKCYWANPENYVHVALREIRRTDILWNENELELYEKL